MKIVTLLVTSVLAGGLLTISPAMADNGSTMTPVSTQSSGEPPAQKLEAKTMASEILASIGMANIALIYGLHDEASNFIFNARENIRDFDNQMAQYDSPGAMTAGKLSYKTAQGNLDYWIPVVNERFAVRTIGSKFLASKNPDVDVTDAQMVHYKMVLDTKVADEQLVKAQNAISKKKYDVAMNALQNISKGTITEMVVEDRPLEATRDNLILSKELLQDKDYRGASFALKHANTELAKYEKSNPSTADNMQSQIYNLQTSIDKEDPTALETAEVKIDGWIKSVKAKI